MKSFPHYPQLDTMDCGPACLRMIAKYYGRHYTLQTLRERSFITREGVSAVWHLLPMNRECIWSKCNSRWLSARHCKHNLPL
ncbi:aBC transporter ATP-binding protein [Prevotella sp. CAG:891]|nr:aBC transporter ATP-binding protein [Prevotella sp. CAG:891]